MPKSSLSSSSSSSSYSVGPFHENNNNKCSNNKDDDDGSGGAIDNATHFLNILQRQVPIFLSKIIHSLQNNYNIDVTHYQADHVCWRTETIEEYNHLVSILTKTTTSKSVATTARNDDGDDDDDDDEQKQKPKPPLFKLLIESMIGGRPIATFEICHPADYIRCDGNHHVVISVIEIPSPKKEGRSSTCKPSKFGYKSGLEHVEFVIGKSSRNGTIDEAAIITSPMNDERHQVMFDEFIKKHNNQNQEQQQHNHHHHQNQRGNNIPWNEKARHKDINPDISITLKIPVDDEKDDGGSNNKNGTSHYYYYHNYSVKFHGMSLKDVIEYEKLHNKVEHVVVT